MERETKVERDGEGEIELRERVNQKDQNQEIERFWEGETQEFNWEKRTREI
jgi:hypothetical protein